MNHVGVVFWNIYDSTKLKVALGWKNIELFYHYVEENVEKYIPRSSRKLKRQVCTYHADELVKLLDIRYFGI